MLSNSRMEVELIVREVLKRRSMKGDRIIGPSAIFDPDSTRYSDFTGAASRVRRGLFGIYALPCLRVV